MIIYYIRLSETSLSAIYVESFSLLIFFLLLYPPLLTHVYSNHLCMYKFCHHLYNLFTHCHNFICHKLLYTKLPDGSEREYAGRARYRDRLCCAAHAHHHVLPPCSEEPKLGRSDIQTYTSLTATFRSRGFT